MTLSLWALPLRQRQCFAHRGQEPTIALLDVPHGPQDLPVCPRHLGILRGGPGEEFGPRSELDLDEDRFNVREVSSA